MKKITIVYIITLAASIQTFSRVQLRLYFKFHVNFCAFVWKFQELSILLLILFIYMSGLKLKAECNDTTHKIVNIF